MFLSVQRKKNKKGRRLSLAESNSEPQPKVQKIPEFELTSTLKNLIKKDKDNQKLWKECLENKTQGFLQLVSLSFMCICCHEVVRNPITTECKHNICRVVVFSPCSNWIIIVLVLAMFEAFLRSWHLHLPKLPPRAGITAFPECKWKPMCNSFSTVSWLWYQAALSAFNAKWSVVLFCLRVFVVCVISFVQNFGNCCFLWWKSKSFQSFNIQIMSVLLVILFHWRVPFVFMFKMFYLVPERRTGT